MSAIMWIFRILSGAVSLYVLACLVRILLTWIPNLNNSKFGRIMSDICDPYLNMFRNIRFLRIGPIDFSPILAIGILLLIPSILNQIVVFGTIKIGYILAAILTGAWSIFVSILTFFNIIVAIRFVVALLKKDYSSSIWQTLDQLIYPIQSKVQNIFFKNKAPTNTMLLGITLLCCIAVQVIGSWLIGLIGVIFTRLPF